MLVKCSPIVISSYTFIQKKLKGDNSNQLYQYNASQMSGLKLINKRAHSCNSPPL